LSSKASLTDSPRPQQGNNGRRRHQLCDRIDVPVASEEVVDNWNLRVSSAPRSAHVGAFLGNKHIAAAWNRSYQVAARPQQSSERQDIYLQIILFHDAVGPHCVHECVFRNNFPSPLHERGKQRESTGSQWLHHAIASDGLFVKVNAQWPNVDHGLSPVFSNGPNEKRGRFVEK
jgi:hypothetical protein